MKGVLFAAMALVIAVKGKENVISSFLCIYKKKPRSNRLVHSVCN